MTELLIALTSIVWRIFLNTASLKDSGEQGEPEQQKLVKMKAVHNKQCKDEIRYKRDNNKVKSHNMNHKVSQNIKIFSTNAAGIASGKAESLVN